MTQPLDTLQSIRARRTLKALSETALPATPPDKAFINTLLESAHWAPYHYPCHRNHQAHLPAELPWRFYVLDSQTCRDLSAKFNRAGIDAGKLSGMLNCADYLIQATWCPQPTDNLAEGQIFDASLTNMEHIAGAGAAVQNLLLTATALGRENYWGSGGVLRKDFAFDWLGIPTSEILLGALFIFPSQADAADSIDFFTGSRRGKRGELADACRWVELS